jgi:hypothetical protein
MSSILEEMDNGYIHLEKLFDQVDRKLDRFHVEIFKNLVRLYNLPDKQFTREGRALTGLRKPLEDLIYMFFQVTDKSTADRFAEGVFERFYKPDIQLNQVLELSDKILNNMRLPGLCAFYRVMKTSGIFSANSKYLDLKDRVKFRKVIQ